jgi:hypothetical protein
MTRVESSKAYCARVFKSRFDREFIDSLLGVLITLGLSAAFLVPLASASGATVETISRALGF